LSPASLTDRIVLMATKYKYDAPGVQQFANELPGPGALDPAAGQPERNAATTEDLEIREFRFSDCGSLNALPHRFELSHPESDGDHPGPLQLIVRRLLSGEESRSPLYVARSISTRQCLGTLQAVQQGVDDRWYLHYLASKEGLDHGNTVHLALLEYAIGQAGRRGARRLMARSDFESPLIGTLRSVGFTAYGREYVYMLPGVPGGTSGKRVRVQEKSDVWSIHQLYLQTTPRDVQSAEALTSHVWDSDTEGRSRRGWFVPTESGASAYIRVRTTRRQHLLDVMYLPAAWPQLPDLFHAVFNTLGSESARPVYVMVRGYQQEMDSLLENMGFGLESDQVMMVRYTTVPVPSSVRPLESFEQLRPAEANGQRVPSFYVRDVHE
jgi:hypothetical protein